MGRAKDIIIKIIPSSVANAFVIKHHYSKSVVQNSILHFGAFLDNKLHGVLSYGNSMDKKKVSQTVKNTGWNEFIELNRMAFDNYLPKNSESRCIAISIKLIKKNAPHIKWILSFADASQCGDGTIYRASGFLLIGIKKNKQILNWNGKIISKKTLDSANYPKINGRYFSNYLLEKNEAKPLEGYQLKYIFLIDKNCQLAVPVLDFNAIDRAGAGMYKGERVSRISRRKKTSAESVTVARPASSGEEGFDSTSALQSPDHEKK